MEYLTKYNEKYALIIGINEYENVNNLEYACNDAQEIKNILIDKFNYKSENIELLLNTEATKNNIMNKYMDYARKTENEDSIFVFYAGHGYTEIANNGDVGYLIPYDGNVKNLYTLIRWDDFTRNADLIHAKHILFVMDACYSGLAITRNVLSGSTRFLKDMLRRYSRQVLTAGKADETVSDGNGPLPNHSIFTGHFIEGLNGKAKSESGLLSANTLMSYVYNKVSNDTYSQQTPHFGYFKGDGDFIFNIEEFLGLFADAKKEDNDILITIPSVITKNILDENTNTLVDKVKDLISNDKNKIKVYDLVNEELRKVLEIINTNSFDDKDENAFSKRIKEYEDTIDTLQSILIVICYWGNTEYVNIVKKVFCILTDSIKSKSGISFLLDLRWYPIYVLFLTSILSCLESENYTILKNLLNITSEAGVFNNETKNILNMASSEINRYNKNFSMFNDKPNYYFPLQEYLYKKLQPKLDDLLFLGGTYSKLFQTTEIIIGFNYAVKNYEKESDRVWGIPGIYAYKYKMNKKIIDEVKENKIFDKIGMFENTEIDVAELMVKYKKYISDLNLF
ncbi:MAG: caspase family protein [Clostridia bacterium]|nr:caspase family protein [Clostridia bacterium]MDD4387022.1 caspase family protein [Clostridia bacterium]